jgi:hypothetical protein
MQRPWHSASLAGTRQLPNPHLRGADEAVPIAGDRCDTLSVRRPGGHQASAPHVQQRGSTAVKAHGQQRAAAAAAAGVQCGHCCGALHANNQVQVPFDQGRGAPHLALSSNMCGTLASSRDDSCSQSSAPPRRAPPACWPSAPPSPRPESPPGRQRCPQPGTGGCCAQPQPRTCTP